jgi:trans-feruloyl-CoA hydratase/vanillin synthase
VLRHAKSAFKFVESLDWDTSEAMLGAMAASAASQDPERGRKRGMAQFLDEKSYRPGLEGYRRDA